MQMLTTIKVDDGVDDEDTCCNDTVWGGCREVPLA